MGASTVCERRVSGLFHSPNRGSFRLSLAVLVHYRSMSVFRLMPWSAQIHTRFHVSGATWDTDRVTLVFAQGAITLSGRFFQIVELTIMNPTLQSRNPKRINPFGLASSPFARRYTGNHFVFFSWVY